jgi:hypothetical protein
MRRPAMRRRLPRPLTTISGAVCCKSDVRIKSQINPKTALSLLGCRACNRDGSIWSDRRQNSPCRSGVNWKLLRAVPSTLTATRHEIAPKPLRAVGRAGMGGWIP